MWNIVQTALLYSLIFFSVWFILNAIAVAYNSTQSLPFGTIVLILIIQGPLPPLSSVPVVCLVFPGLWGTVCDAHPSCPCGCGSCHPSISFPSYHPPLSLARLDFAQA